MIRRLIWVPIGILASASALAAPEPNSSPVCLYESKTFSEGAFVCVQKSLMQVCTADGGRMIWKPVPDKDISDRCTAVNFPHTQAEPRVHPPRRHVLFHRMQAPVAAPAKCFVFKEREYCE